MVMDLLVFVLNCVGYEGTLSVMLSPFQGVPQMQSMKDPLSGTFESTEAYQSFLKEEEAASAPPAPLPLDKQLEVMMEQERLLNPWKYSAELGKQTPLLEFMRANPKGIASIVTGGNGGGDGKKEGKKGKRSKGKTKNGSGEVATAEPVKPKGPKPKQQSKQSSTNAPPAPLKIMSRPKPIVDASSNPPQPKINATQPPANPAQNKVPVANVGPKVFTTSKKAQQAGKSVGSQKQQTEK